MSDLNIMVIVGSLRAASVNAAIARAATSRAPADVRLVVHDVRGLPFYDGDIEAAGVPPEVETLCAAAAAADGLLFFSPEYNSSFPAITKNAIDWLSRPPRAWTDTPVSLVVTTPGGRAGLGLRGHFADSLGHLPIRLFDSLGIGGYPEKLTDGELTDPETLGELARFLSGFADFCRSGDSSGRARLRPRR